MQVARASHALHVMFNCSNDNVTLFDGIYAWFPVSTLSTVEKLNQKWLLHGSESDSATLANIRPDGKAS